MKALRFDGALRLEGDVPLPRREDEALIQVICAGICSTDLEIAKGYAGFQGTLGHEFVGRVVESPDPAWVGRRVVGEINVGCGFCSLCKAGDPRHCDTRTVLGIKGRDGAFAQFLSLPIPNLTEVPDSLTDEEAVFVEPLAAACQILEQVEVTPGSRVAVIGDGKLAQLIIQVLARTGCDLAVIGKHEWKLDLAAEAGARGHRIENAARHPSELAAEALAALGGVRFDVVVEASGSPTGLPIALGLARPRGTVVLKSTHQVETLLDTAPVVVNELTIVGSRCGRFGRAVELLARGAVNVIPLVSRRLTLDEGFLAFAEAEHGRNLKVILNIR